MVEYGYNGRENIERYATNRMGRAVKFVPLEWNHPRDAEGHYLRLRTRMPGDVGTKDGLMPDFSDVADDQIGICAYNTTENIPISPVYRDTVEGRLELLKHCTENRTIWVGYRADREVWAGILFTTRDYTLDVQAGRVEFVEGRP